GGAGQFRGGLGIRREYLNLADARFSIRSTKHVIPPNGCGDGEPGRCGDIWINPERDSAKRLPTRYADYPLRDGDVFEGVVSREAAEREYGVILDAAARAVDQAATAKRRNEMKSKS